MADETRGREKWDDISHLYADRISSGVLVCDTDGVIRDCNQTAARLITLTPGEIVGRSIADLSWLPAAPFFEDGRPAERLGEAALAELRADRPLPTTVIGMRSTDDETVWVIVSAQRTPLDQPPWAPRAVVVTMTDITSQKAAEALYARVADELHGVLHALPDLYFRLDHEGGVVDFHVGSGFDRHMTSDDLLGRRLVDVLPVDTVPSLTKALARARLRGAAESCEVSVAMPGGPAWFEARVVALPDGGAVVIVRDITEQRRAEEALARSERMYRSLVERAPVGICLFDPDLRVTSCNDAAVALTGVTRERFLAADLRGRAFTETLQAALRGREGNVAGVRIPPDADASTTFDLHVQPVLGPDGGVVGGICVITRARPAAA
jgi:PAS domain S-box-containing protein